MKNKFKIIRISVSCLLIAAFFILPESFFKSHSFCPIYVLFNVQCPACGATRAFYDFLHLDFRGAVSFNKPFALALFPIALLLLLDDFLTLLKSVFTKKETVSVMDTVINTLLK